MNRPSIAIVGASRDRRKYGNKCVRAYLQSGFEVTPVNPKGGSIEGLPVVPSVAELASEPDRISLYLQPEITSRLLEEIARFRDTEVWFNPGCCDAATLERARQLGIDVHAGCSIVDIGLSPSQFP